MENVSFVKKKQKIPAWIILILNELKEQDLLEESSVGIVIFLLQNWKTIVHDTELHKEICELYLNHVLIILTGNIFRIYIRLKNQKTLSLRSDPTTSCIKYTVVERSFQSIQEAESLRKNCLSYLHNMDLNQSFTRGNYEIK